MKSAITIKDVATHVGFSVGTVSMALNNSEKIKPSTRAIIQQAAEELGFRKNPFGRSLSTQSSGLVGCIVPDLTNNFYGEMIYHLQEEFNKAGYGIVVGCSNEKSVTENDLIQRFIDKGVDGIITVPVSDPNVKLENIKDLVKKGYPIVFISSYYSEIPRYTVMCDLAEGMYQLTKLLIDQGHKNIVIVTGRKGHTPTDERLAGFNRALKEKGITLDPSCYIESSKQTFLGAYSAINDVYLEKRPDLVVAINDIMAMGIISSLKTQNLRIPEDVSVTGFDDIAISAFQETPLTTVSQSIKEMCREATKLMLERMKGNAEDVGVIKVTPHVVERRSTKNLKEN